MSHEFTQGHNAWSQRVAKEHHNSKWFYKTVSASSPRSPVSPRWKELSAMLNRPDYEANYDFLRSQSTYGFTRPASRSQLVSQFLTTRQSHEDRIRFAFERQPSRASEVRPYTAAAGLRHAAVQTRSTLGARASGSRTDRGEEAQERRLRDLLSAEKARRKKAEQQLNDMMHSR